MEMGDDDMEIRGIEHGNLSWPLLMAISLCLLFFSFSYHPVVPLLWFPQIFIPLPLDVSAGCFLLLCFFFFFFVLRFSCTNAWGNLEGWCVGE